MLKKKGKVKNIKSKKTSNNKNLIIIEYKIFHFHFDLHEDIHKNLKHEIDSIIKRNRFLAEQIIKNNMKLLFKYNHGNDIHEHGKQ